MLAPLAPLSARRRIPLEEVPEDEGKCSAWLHKLYQEKVSARVCRTQAPIAGRTVGARGVLRGALGGLWCR